MPSLASTATTGTASAHDERRVAGVAGTWSGSNVDVHVDGSPARSRGAAAAATRIARRPGNDAAVRPVASCRARWRAVTACRAGRRTTSTRPVARRGASAPGAAGAAAGPAVWRSRGRARRSRPGGRAGDGELDDPAEAQVLAPERRERPADPGGGDDGDEEREAPEQCGAG